jgi:hypothetical protein
LGIASQTFPKKYFSFGLPSQPAFEMEIINILEKNDLKLLDDWARREDGKEIDRNDQESLNFTDLISPKSTVNEKLFISKSPYGTGIFTRSPIKAGEELVSIDIQDLILDNSSGVDHDFFKRFPQLELIYTVLSTPNHSSYLNSLPKTQILPMYYSHDELLLLKNSLNYPEIISDYKLQFKQYSLLLKILSDCNIKPSFGFRKFQWARQVVLSRHNPIKVLKKGRIESHYCLAPVFDLFNHGKGFATGYFGLEKSRLILESGNDIENGN